GAKNACSTRKIRPFLQQTATYLGNVGSIVEKSIKFSVTSNFTGKRTCANPSEDSSTIISIYTLITLQEY
ncbi:hypothetical protein, partial [Yoonia sp.]|uniref:hypothetical protein n=1 Tax=Yoonia sp. TaxID=2212373 RepID=UPI003A4D49D6